MDEVLRQSVPLAIAVFLVTAMLSLGLDLTIKQVLEPMRKRRLVVMSLLVRTRYSAGGSSSFPVTMFQSPSSS